MSFDPFFKNNINDLSRYSESIDDLRALYDKKERKILKKQQLYEGFMVKLNVSSLLHGLLHMKVY